MRATELLADPLIDVTAQLLTGPVQHFYALLWRMGVLEVGAAAPTRPVTTLRPLPQAG